MACFAEPRPICNGCNEPVRDVSDQFLRLVKETHRGEKADAVYLCPGRCQKAYLQVEEDHRPVSRRWLEALEA